MLSIILKSIFQTASKCNVSVPFHLVPDLIIIRIPVTNIWCTGRSYKLTGCMSYAPFGFRVRTQRSCSVRNRYCYEFNASSITLKPCDVFKYMFMIIFIIVKHLKKDLMIYLMISSHFKAKSE